MNWEYSKLKLHVTSFARRTREKSCGLSWMFEQVQIRLECTKAHESWRKRARVGESTRELTKAHKSWRKQRGMMKAHESWQKCTRVDESARESTEAHESWRKRTRVDKSARELTKVHKTLTKAHEAWRKRARIGDQTRARDRTLVNCCRSSFSVDRHSPLYIDGISKWKFVSSYWSLRLLIKVLRQSKIAETAWQLCQLF